MANTHSLDLELSSSQHAFITDGNQTGLDITGDITIECWVKLEQLPSTASSNFVLVSKYDTNSQRSYQITFQTSDKIRLSYSPNGSAPVVNITADDAITSGDVGTWVHWAMSVDVSASDGVLYRNGSSVAETASGSGTSIHNGTAKFAIGANFSSGTAQGFHDGLIDEVRVWNDIRSAGEISANYLKELVGDEAGLVAYYKLNNDYEDADSGGNNDLTASGSPVFSTDNPFPITGGGNPMFFSGGGVTVA